MVNFAEALKFVTSEAKCLKMSQNFEIWPKCHEEPKISRAEPSEGVKMIKNCRKLLFPSAGARRAPAAKEKIASRGNFLSFSPLQRARKVTILGSEWHFGTISTILGPFWGILRHEWHNFNAEATIYHHIFPKCVNRLVPTRFKKKFSTWHFGSPPPQFSTFWVLPP